MEVSVIANSSESPATEAVIHEKKKTSRGANCSLDIVWQYLASGQCPKGYTKNDKRALKRRAQSFVVIEEQLYYTGGRSRHCNGDGEEETAENPESYPDYTQVLRKCCLTEEEKQEAVTRAHIGDDGTHYGMERTTERVSSQFYWLGIIHSVRNLIHNCSSCASRSRGPSVATNGNVGVSASASSTSVQSNKNADSQQEITKVEKPEVYFIPQETCSYFWQKVELQIFGPYPAGKEQVYVAVALDTYSQFPEAVVLQSVTMASLTNFILNLVCRYGVMERLVILQNHVTKHSDVSLNVEDIQQAGIVISQQHSLANPADERWKHVERSLQRFVSFYPTLWDKCLEAFMVPLRISLPPEAEYSPTYLTFGRELNLPEQLNHRNQEEWLTEIRLSEEQEQQTVDLMIRAFGLYSRNPSVQPARTSDVKPPTKPSTEPKNSSKTRPAVVISPPRRKGKRGRRRKEREEEEEAMEEDTKIELTEADVSEDTALEDFTDPALHQREETPGVRSSKRLRKATYKVKEEMLNRKQRLRSSSHSKDGDKNHKTVTCQASKQTTSNISSAAAPAAKSVGKGQMKKSSGQKASKMEEGKESDRKETSAEITSCLGQLALDVYYFILKQYKEHGTFPPHVSVATQQAIQQLSQMVELKDARLHSCVGKSAGRVVVANEKARFSLLEKAHVRGEMHYDRNGALKHLLEMNVFWKGMSLDLDAFIHACPDCIQNNPMHNKPVIRIPSKSKVLPPDRDDLDPHVSEDEEEDCRYEDLIQYLTDGTFPSSLSASQQSQIKQRANFFCIINGSLHYQPLSRPTASPRQVLFAESGRQAAIREAHIEDGIHLSQNETQAKLRESYFWSGMTYDVIRFIATCCRANSFCTPPIPHRNPIIQKRVEKFRTYYQEGIPVFDKTILMDSLAGASVHPDSDGQAGTQHANRWMEDEAVRNAVESIIAEMGGSKAYTDPGETLESICATPRPVNLTKSGKVRSRRDCHKCNHCGRTISGTVAFRVHLYKHTGVKPFSCSECPKKFTTHKSLQVHMRKHRGVRPYLCNQCGREFFRGTSFRYHLKSHTRGKLAPLPCDQCSRTFATQNRLDRHKEFKHPTEPRVFMCNQCGKVFTAARSLKWHEQTHSGARRFQCEHCNKSFARKEALDNHSVSVHTTKWDELAIKHQTTQPEAVSETTVNINQPAGEVMTISASHPSGEVITSVIQWTEEEQRRAAERISQQNLIVTDLDVYQTQVPASHAEQTTTHVLTAAQVHPTIHLAPASLPTHGHHAIHTLQPTDILLHDSVPVQYEVECLSGDPLTEADLNAVHMLAHASLGGQNIMQHLNDRT